MESPTSNIVQVRPAGMSPELCTVSFDDRIALSQTFAQARLTFAVKTGRSSSGRLEACDPSAHSDCWTYRQRCTRDDVNVDDINYGHFHLNFERPVCLAWTDDGTPIPPDPGDGYGSGFGRIREGRCDAIDWTSEPRVFASMAMDHWVKISVGNAVTRTPTYFDMESIWVLPNKPIQLWFRKRDRSWWFWAELSAGTIWNISEWVRDVSEVRIRGTESGSGPYTIGAFGIRD